MQYPTGSPLPARRPDDVYETAPELAEAAIRLNNMRIVFDSPLVFDPGAGSGVWGQAFNKIFAGKARVDGCDIRNLPKPEGYDIWSPNTDFTQIMPVENVYDFIIGNPPYRHTEEFVRKSLIMLAPDGVIMFLLRLQFLGSQKRAKGLFAKHPPFHVTIVAKRPSFSGNRKTSKGDEYGLFFWHKYPEFDLTTLDWMEGY